MLAEEVGWDGVFLEDYICFQGDPVAPTCDPWVALAAIAVRTRRVRLGTMVTPISRRRPWKLAWEVLGIDRLSGGRMVLGVGLGDTGEHVVGDASFSSFAEARDTGVPLPTWAGRAAGSPSISSSASRPRNSGPGRAGCDSRIVPACPDLVQLLRRHLDQFALGPDGRLFVTRTGRFGRPVAAPYSNPVSTNTYTRVWRRAREATLTPAQLDSPLAARPYDLRHACVSLWLNAGVPATQVAEWAGHSVHVLMRVYAKCVHGQEEAARRRVEAALGGGATDLGGAEP